MMADPDRKPFNPGAYAQAMRKLSEAVDELRHTPLPRPYEVAIQQAGDWPELFLCTDGGCELATSYEVVDVLAALIPYLDEQRADAARRYRNSRAGMTAPTRNHLAINDQLLRKALRVHIEMTTDGDGDLPIAQSTWDEQTIIASFIKWLREARAAEAVRSRRAGMREAVIRGGKA